MSFTKNLSKKYGNQLFDTATKTGPDALKTASEKVIHEVVEAADKFIETKSLIKL